METEDRMYREGGYTSNYVSLAIEPLMDYSDRILSEVVDSSREVVIYKIITERTGGPSEFKKASGRDVDQLRGSNLSYGDLLRIDVAGKAEDTETSDLLAKLHKGFLMGGKFVKP